MTVKGRKRRQKDTRKEERSKEGDKERMRG